MVIIRTAALDSIQQTRYSKHKNTDIYFVQPFRSLLDLAYLFVVLKYNRHKYLSIGVSSYLSYLDDHRAWPRGNHPIAAQIQFLLRAVQVLCEAAMAVSKCAIFKKLDTYLRSLPDSPGARRRFFNLNTLLITAGMVFTKC